MARYTGPKTKIARKFHDPIYGPDKNYEKKPYAPGMHGANKRRGKMSGYGIQLQEKQKVKYTYGILERQFRKIYSEASRRGGITGEELMKLIESRLDNVVYRLGIARSRAQARQLVSHCHITVNGNVVNIPSYSLKEGDVVSVRERSKSLEIIVDSLASRASNYPWLEWDATSMSGKFVNYPQRADIPENVNEQLIVELYSK